MTQGYPTIIGRVRIAVCFCSARFRRTRHFINFPYHFSQWTRPQAVHQPCAYSSNDPQQPWTSVRTASGLAASRIQTLGETAPAKDHGTSESDCSSVVRRLIGLTEYASGSPTTTQLGHRCSTEAKRREEEPVLHEAPGEREGEPDFGQRGLPEDATGRVRPKRKRIHQRCVRARTVLVKFSNSFFQINHLL